MDAPIGSLRPRPQASEAAPCPRRKVPVLPEPGHQPRFSVIVPTYNVQAWVRACLTSLVEQRFNDFEVIIVDDRGDDRSIDIAREFTVDERFRIAEMPQNGGLGPARNLGIDEAVGEYLVFLDSDDLLRADALERIDREVELRESPDVVLYDYSRLNWWGTLAPNSMNEVLRRHAGHVVSVDDAPDLLRIFHVAWNKAYRRDWLVGTEIRFYPGFYEDVPWTYPVMMSARSVCVIPESLYLYRQRYEGSILSSKSERHLELLEQYERLFDEAAELPNFERHAALLFDQLVFHVRSLVRTNMDRIPRSAKMRFYSESAQLVERFRIYEDRSAPAGVRRRTRLLGSPLWPLFPALKTVNAIRARTRARRDSILRWKPIGAQRARLMQAFHRTAVRLPQRRRVAVYMSYWGDSQSCNPAAIAAAQHTAHPDVDSFWVLKSWVSSAVPHSRRILPGSWKERWLMGRATHVISNVNPPDWWTKRAGAVHLQTQHGTPLKVMGLHTRGTQAAPKMSYSKLLDRCARWDYCLSSNPFSTEIWPAAFPVSFTSIEAGYPRNDCLFDSEYVEGTSAEVRRSYGIPSDARVVLYAPTFREYEQTFSPHISWESALEELPDDTYVMVRAHHSYRASVPEAHPRLVDASRHRLVEELYAAADVLVTDYSSVMFDFANLGRPILLLLDDLEKYADYRGLYFDIRDELPGLTADDPTQLVEMLRQETYSRAAETETIARFRAKFCAFDDGNAAHRVVETLFF